MQKEKKMNVVMTCASVGPLLTFALLSVWSITDGVVVASFLDFVTCEKVNSVTK